MKEASVGIIGGADGPTAVMVTGELLPVILIAGAIVLVAALIVTAIVVSRKNKG